MLLKPFETSLSIVYKVKGEVKVIRDRRKDHKQISRPHSPDVPQQKWAGFSHTLKDGGQYKMLRDAVIHSNLPLLREEVHQIIPLLLLLF